VHPDGRIIPFDTFNMFYRDNKEQRLKRLKEMYEPQPATFSIGGKAVP
jgi:uncharacterized radical SAM superfamily Fe-S cluster-containing enzyme